MVASKSPATVSSAQAKYIPLSQFTLSAPSWPDDRHPTDPKSLSSAANPQAKAIPVDECFYTRSIGGPSWSPDGKWIVDEYDRGGYEHFDLYATPIDGNAINRTVAWFDRYLKGEKQ